jgi:phage terminase small subunit
MMRKTNLHIPSYNDFMTKTLVRPKTQYAPGIDLTPKQRAFVVALVRNGTTPTAAAREAGYNNPKVSSFDVLRLPHVAAAIRMERQRYISGELANIATGTLRHILTDSEAPASARVQAARTVLEMSGDIGKAKRQDDEDRPLSEMTAEELARMIDKWTEEKAALATTIDAQDVEIIDSAQSMAQLTPATRTPA